MNKKQLFMLGLGTVAVTTTISKPAEAFNSGKEQVFKTGNINYGVNVRTGPGIEYSKTGYLYRGSEVVIKDTSNPRWVEVEYNNKTGYIFKDYVTIKESKKGIYKEVKENTLVYNNNKDTSFITSVIGKGRKVLVLNEQSVWSTIVDRGQERFIKTENLKDSNPIQKTETKYVRGGVNVRSRKTVNSVKVGYLTHNTKIQGIVEGNWLRIKYNGKDAFISMKLLEDKPNIKEENNINDKNDSNLITIETIDIIDTIPVYLNANDALNKINIRTNYSKGKYYIYKKHNGMINISQTKNKPGGWINPSENIIKEIIEDNNSNNSNLEENNSNNTQDYNNNIITDSSQLMLEGMPVLKEQQMINYLKRVYPNAPQKVLDLPKIFLEEGLKEGIRGDIAFAQSLLETGNFKFPGSLLSLEDNNFSGLGATGGGVKGNEYSSPEIGVRAQIQHLKAYANDKPLNLPLEDNRFHYVKRGSAPNVKYLGIQENPNGFGWAAGANYGDKILTIYNSILKTL